MEKRSQKIPQQQKSGANIEGSCFFGPDRNLREQTPELGSVLQYNVSLPVLLLLCFFHAVAEALPPLTFLPPLIPLLLTFELCTERWETWPCLPGRLTKAAAATALCSWEEEEKEWGTPLTPTEETPWDSWPWELCGQEQEGVELEQTKHDSFL